MDFPITQVLALAHWWYPEGKCFSTLFRSARVCVRVRVLLLYPFVMEWSILIAGRTSLTDTIAHVTRSAWSSCGMPHDMPRGRYTSFNFTCIPTAFVYVGSAVQG